MRAVLSDTKSRQRKLQESVSYDYSCKNKILTNWILLKGLHTFMKWDLSRVQEWVYIWKSPVLHTIVIERRKKAAWLSQYILKKCLTKSTTLFHDKNTPQIRDIRELPQPDKRAFMKNPQLTWHWWKTECFTSKIRNETKMSSLTTSI